MAPPAGQTIECSVGTPSIGLLFPVESSIHLSVQSTDESNLKPSLLCPPSPLSRRGPVHGGGEAADHAVFVRSLRARPVAAGERFHPHVLSQRRGERPFVSLSALKPTE